MEILRQVKIGTRLAAAFGVVLLLLVGTAVVGVMNSTSALQESEKIGKNNRAAVALSEAQNAVWALRWGVAQFIAVTDPSDRKQIIDGQAKLRQQFDDAVRRYVPDAGTEQEKALLKELGAAFDKYITARTKWFQLYGDNDPDAVKYRAEHLTPAGGATVKHLSALIVLQQQLATAHEQQAAESMKVGRFAIVALSAMGLVIASLLAWMVARSITRPLREAVHSAARVAEGDLAHTLSTSGRDEVAHLALALNSMSASLSGIVFRIRTATDAISSASRQLSAGNADLSQRTEEQASSLEETASSMEELYSTVRQNAENAQQANQLAAGASSVAVKGGRVVGEAARAGEQGRGFAVVASEVRGLAQRSAAAAREIKALITDSVSKVEDGSQLVNEAGKTMDEIVNAVKRVTDIMAEIAAAAQEQGSGIEQVNGAVTQMDQATQQNAALVEEAAAAAESLDEQAQQLTQAVAVFKLADAERRAPTAAVARPAGAATIAPTPAPEKVARLHAKPAPKPVPASAAVAKKAVGDAGEWKTF